MELDHINLRIEQPQNTPSEVRYRDTPHDEKLIGELATSGALEDRLEKFRKFKRRSLRLKDSGASKSKSPRGYAPDFPNPGPLSPPPSRRVS